VKIAFHRVRSNLAWAHSSKPLIYTKLIAWERSTCPRCAASPSAYKKGNSSPSSAPSGSGKSTLFYLLGGLTRADSGKVIMDGDDFATLSDAERTRMRKRKIGFVFQKFNLLPTLDAVRTSPSRRKSPATADRDPAFFARICDLLGLSKRLNHRPSELSGGEQQRVALARALVNKPAMVLADEPTGNLDTENSNIVLKMLRQSNQELGQTVLMITHNPEAAKYRRPHHPHARRPHRAAGGRSAVVTALRRLSLDNVAQVRCKLLRVIYNRLIL
jgi:putative ABC transport system ATP-binding protein